MKNLFVLISILLITSCFPTQNALSRYTIDNGFIPKRFGKTNSTLVIIRSDNELINDALKLHAENELKCKYKFARKSKLSYMNKDTYRYLFNYKEKEIEYYSYDPNIRQSRRQTTINYSFYMRDRQTGKTYGKTYSSANYFHQIKAYFRNLSTVWISNQPEPAS